MFFNFPISREDERNLPKFSNVREARNYFVERYGDKYNYGDRERSSEYQLELFGEYIYFDDVNGQPVQIGSNGYVHVVY